MIEKLNIDMSQTSEKFQHINKEILIVLIEKMEKLDKLELEMFEKTSPSEIGFDLRELWKTYGQSCEEIIAPIRIKPNTNNLRSYGKPLKYEYLSNTSTKIEFIMKSAKLAVIEFHFEAIPGSYKYEQFTFKNIENEWKIDSKKCCFSKKSKWMIDEI
jgi:hypothetical protein